MYDYYWEVDFSSAGAGHQHDWEHIAVFASDVADQDASNTVAVCTSAHGEWDCEWREDPSKSWDGDHPKVRASHVTCSISPSIGHKQC